MSRLWKRAAAMAMTTLLLTAMSLWAQAGPEPGQGPRRGPGGPGGPMRISPEERADRLAQTLSLSADQKTKVLEILKNEQKQMSDLREDSSLSREARMDKGKEIHDGTNTQIRALLNADQQKKFDEMQERMKNMGPRRGPGPEHPQP